MARNASNINSKSRTHMVCQISDTKFRVISGGSGNEYEVEETEHGFTCNCKFGNPYGGKYGRKQSGCSHVVSVIRVVEAEKGRTVSVHSDRESAERQHRPMEGVGQGLFVTSRAA